VTDDPTGGETIGDAPAPASTAGTLAAGTWAGAFRIERRLGGGGMGTVYEALDPAIQKRAAVKVLNVALGDDAGAIARFEREARAANEIRHPAVVDVFALGRLPDGRPYLVMSLLEGRSLRAELDARGTLEPTEAWAIAREVGDALTAAHETGVVHRDLKPDNVFLEQLGGRRRVRVLDFGLAKLSQAGVSLTASGAVMGTPAYMSPEQWWGRGVEAPADQYALGVMLHEMLSGSPPFVADSFPAYLQKHLHEPPPSIRASRPDLPDAVGALLRRALAKAPEQRFARMRDLCEAGDRAFAGLRTSTLDETVVTAPPARSASTPGPRARALPLLALLLSLGLLVAAGYTGEAGHDPREWLHIAGWPGPIAVAMLVAAIALVLLSRSAWVVVALLVVNGVLGSFSGSRAVLGGLARTPRTARFEFFNLGIYECNASPFLAFGVASAICLAIAWQAGRAWTWTRDRWAAAGALVALAAAAMILGAPAAAYLAAAGVIAVLAGQRRPDDARRELSQACASALAVGLACAVALSRVHARESALWQAELSRAARAAEIVAAAAERSATLTLAAGALAVVLAVEALRMRRLRAAGPVPRPGFGGWTLVAVALLGAITWIALAVETSATREQFRQELSPQFTLFARLDPPLGGPLDAKRFPTRKGPALQIARNAVAVDGRGVATLASLQTEEGLANVGAEINRARAGAIGDLSAPDERDPVDLVVICDREVPWGTVLRLLRLARRSGAERIDLLLSRGPAPKPLPGAPAEAGWVVPTDFVAVPARLADSGLAPDAGARFGDAAPELIRLAQSRPGTPIALAVQR